MSTKMTKKQRIADAVIPRALIAISITAGSIIVGFVSNGYTIMAHVIGSTPMNGNWAGIFSTTVVVGLFSAFIAAQLLLVRRRKH